MKPLDIQDHNLPIALLLQLHCCRQYKHTMAVLVSLLQYNYREKKQMFILMHEMATRWCYIQNFVFFKFSDSVSALCRGHSTS